MFGLEWGTIKLIAIGLAVAAVLGYIGFLKVEVSHYKDKANKIEVAFDQYKNANEANHKALLSENQALTLKVKEQGIEELKQIAKTKEANDKAIRYYNLGHRLNLELIRVLNDIDAKSKSQGNGTSSTEPGHDGGTDTTTAVTPFTEEDLALTWNENTANHLSCIVIVHKWQNFWKDFVSNVEKAGG